MSYKISIIIPVYNVEKYLRQCLQSVSEQTFKDFEAIIIDNNSPDNSAAIIQEFVDKHPNFKTFKKIGGGLGGARNEGIKHATGEYLVFLDSDDWITPDALQSLYNAVSNDNADIAACPHYKATAYGTKLNKNSHRKKHSFIIDTQKDGAVEMLKEGISNGCAWGKIFKRDIITSNSILFPENTPYEDVAFIAVCFLLAKRYIYVNKPLWFYRYVSTSISNTKSEMAPKSLFNNFSMMRDFLKSRGLYHGDIAEEFEYRYLHMTIGGEQAGNGGLKKLSRPRLKEFFELSRDFYLNMPEDFFKKRNIIFKIKYKCFKIALKYNIYTLHKYTRFPINLISIIYGVFKK